MLAQTAFNTKIIDAVELREQLDAERPCIVNEIRDIEPTILHRRITQGLID